MKKFTMLMGVLCLSLAAASAQAQIKLLTAAQMRNVSAGTYQVPAAILHPAQNPTPKTLDYLDPTGVIRSLISYNLVVTGVTYGPNGPNSVLNSDGSYTVYFPQSIQKIDLQNLTFSGGTPIGDVTLNHIRFSPGSKMTLIPH